MASELSRLIEDELKHKGYYKPEDDKEDEEAPHQALMGALRVEVRGIGANVGPWHVVFASWRHAIGNPRSSLRSQHADLDPVAYRHELKKCRPRRSS